MRPEGRYQFRPVCKYFWWLSVRKKNLVILWTQDFDGTKNCHSWTITKLFRYQSQLINFLQEELVTTFYSDLLSIKI